MASRKTQNDEGIPVERAMTILKEAHPIQYLHSTSKNWVNEITNFIQEGNLPNDAIRAK